VKAAKPMLDSMNRLINAAASQLQVQDSELSIGYVVLPYNMSAYIDMFDELILEAFDIQHYWPVDKKGDYWQTTTMDARDAAKRVFGLSDAGNLGAHDVPDNEHSYVLVLSFELDYLEISYACYVDYGASWCDSEVIRHSSPQAFPELGESAIGQAAAAQYSDSWSMPQKPLDPKASSNGSDDDAAETLAAGIAAFMERTSFPGQKENLRAVILTGGASNIELLRRAAHNGLPFLDPSRFKILDPDAAFTPSLGAAMASRHEYLREDKVVCNCHMDEAWRKENGYPLHNEWPCHLSDWLLAWCSQDERWSATPLV
jgi:hypothetical protein